MLLIMDLSILFLLVLLTGKYGFEALSSERTTLRSLYGNSEIYLSMYAICLFQNS